MNTSENKAQKKLIEIAVLSYDGQTENVIEKLLDGKASEYDFVVQETNKLNNFLGGAK